MMEWRQVKFLVMATATLKFYYWYRFYLIVKAILQYSKEKNIKQKQKIYQAVPHISCRVQLLENIKDRDTVRNLRRPKRSNSSKMKKSNSKWKTASVPSSSWRTFDKCTIRTHKEHSLPPDENEGKGKTAEEESLSQGLLLGLFYRVEITHSRTNTRM